MRDDKFCRPIFAQGPQLMNYVCFVRDRIEIIKKHRFFIEVNNRDQCLYVAEFNQYCAVALVE
jgi:hypothetical protein